MSNIVLITFTGENAAGGVPRWVRDFKIGFPNTKSYSWNDFVDEFGSKNGPEWEKARLLNWWLKETKKVTKDDIIIVDGFWGLGLEEFPNVVSVCHGIWSHLIKEEADAGIKPDFPHHHEAQVKYRREHLERGGRLVSVSHFIRYQMEIQWGFKSHVINNAIDLNKYKPTNKIHPFDEYLAIHGINDKGNKNKGWDHIEYCMKNWEEDCKFLSLDEAHAYLKIFHPNLDKYEALAMADFVIIPSAYEGNSYFALETLACDVPVVAYDVGLFFEIKRDYHTQNHPIQVGEILKRQNRTPEETLKGVDLVSQERQRFQPRRRVEQYSIEEFCYKWKSYLKKEFNYE